MRRKPAFLSQFSHFYWQEKWPNMWDRTKGIEKIAKYCAYQERCHAEVRRKLYEMGAPTEDVEEALVMLITEGFLDEERFARAYTRGKFRQKQWGRIKIRHELRGRHIGERLIERVLAQEINSQDYLAAAQAVADKKMDQLQDYDDFVKARKVEKYLQSRGYEWDIIREVVS